MIQFKFNIGDTVAAKAGEEQSNVAAAYGEEREPTAFTIVERLSQECPGGVQYLYKLGGTGGILRNEIELMPYSETDFAGRHAKRMEYRLAKEAEEEKRYADRIEARRKAREEAGK